MSEEPDQALLERAKALNDNAAKKFGEAEWHDRLTALGKAGVVGEAAKQLVMSGDLDLIDRVSTVAMCANADSAFRQADGTTGSREYDREAEAAYSRLRQAQREAHRKARGR